MKPSESPVGATQKVVARIRFIVSAALSGIAFSSLGSVSYSSTWLPCAVRASRSMPQHMPQHMPPAMPPHTAPQQICLQPRLSTRRMSAIGHHGMMMLCR